MPPRSQFGNGPITSIKQIKDDETFTESKLMIPAGDATRVLTLKKTGEGLIITQVALGSGQSTFKEDAPNFGAAAVKIYNDGTKS